MGTTTKGFVVPTDPVRPHIDIALKDLAESIDAIFASMSDAELTAVAGAGLWDGRFAFQTDVGAVRKWRGLYEYVAAAAAWKSLVPVGAFSTFTPALTATSVNPTLGTPAQGPFGWYAQFGAQIIGRGYIEFGATGTAGTGTWLVSLPVAHAYTPLHTIGKGGWNRRTATISYYTGELELVDSTHAKIVGNASAGSAGADLASTTISFSATNAPYLYYTFRYRGVI